MKVKKFLWLVLMAITLVCGTGCVKDIKDLRALNIVDVNGHGETQNSVKLNNQSGAPKGEKVILTIFPDEGYLLDKIECSEGGLKWPEDFTKDEENSNENKQVYFFIMPDSNVQLQVLYKEIPPETYTVTFGDYDITKVSLRTDKDVYTKGEKVTVTATSNFAFDISVSVSDTVDVTTVTENKKWTFDMPAENVTVKVDISGYKYKVNVTDGKSKNGIKLEFENIPEDADRRDIFLGTGNNKKQIHRAASWMNTDDVKAKSYFYPLTETGKDYDFTVEYIRNDTEPWECLSSETITIKAQGGIGSVECINENSIDFKIDGNGNFEWKTKPLVDDNTTSSKQIIYGFEAFDVESDDSSQYFWVGKWDWSKDKAVYNNFNIIDIICGWDKPDAVKNKEIIDKLVKGKKVVISTTVSYEVRDSYDEPYEMEIFNSEYWSGNPKNLFTLEPSPLLGTWMGKSRSYTFYQNKVVVEDAVSKTEYSYTYTDETVTFDGKTYEYEIDAERTKLSISEDDDVVRKYTRSMFGSNLEAGYENAEIKVENNVLKFVQAPGAKTVPEGITGYRVDFCTEGENADDYGWLASKYVYSLSFDDINIDDFIWNKDLVNKTLKINIIWGTNWQTDTTHMLDRVIRGYEVGAGYERPVTSSNGTVVTMTKPGSKILALYPNTDHYTVFVHNEANKFSDWLGYKEFALTDNITFDLCDLGIDSDKIINDQVNLCLELKAANENLEARLTDDNWVPFNGYRYIVKLSENSAGINNGISINMSGVPSEAKSCQIHILKGAIGHQIYWTDNPSELKKTSFFYPFVNANTEYTIQVQYYGEDIKLSQSIIKITPKGGLGELLPVNANDVSCKVESKSLIWETKPTFVNHTGGYVSIGFFGENWDGYYGEVHVDYALLKTSAYTKIDLSENVDVDGFMVSVKTIPRKGVLQYIYHADDGSGIYDGYSSEIEFKNHAFEY